jgi:hypothetical protein
MKKQTAVEWLVEQLKLEGYDHTVEQAKAMEKEQMIDAYNEGSNQNGFPLKHEAEQYYNETYNTDTQ